MNDASDDRPRSRRQLLALAGTVGFAGCPETRLDSAFPGDGGSPGSDPVAGTTADATATNAPTTADEPTTDSPPANGTADPEPDSTIDGVPVVRNRYSLRALPYEKRPQFYGPFRESGPECRHDATRVREVPDLVPTEIGGDSGHFPLRTTRWLLRLLQCYRETGDGRYRRRAAEMSDALVEDAGVGEDGAL